MICSRIPGISGKRIIPWTTVWWVNMSWMWREYKSKIYENIQFWNLKTTVQNREVCFQISARVDLLITHKRSTSLAFLSSTKLCYEKRYMKYVYVTFSTSFTEHFRFHRHSKMWVCERLRWERNRLLYMIKIKVNMLINY